MYVYSIVMYTKNQTLPARLLPPSLSFTANVNTVIPVPIRSGPTGR